MDQTYYINTYPKTLIGAWISYSRRIRTVPLGSSGLSDDLNLSASGDAQHSDGMSNLSILSTPATIR